MDTSLELERLTKLIASVVASPHSDFYRKLYNVPAGSVPNLHTWDDWHLVPSFTKEAFLDLSMREYTFIPQKKVETIYYTSGTSGKRPAFCSSRMYAGNFNYRKVFHDCSGALLVSIKAPHRTDAVLRDSGSSSRSIHFDGKNIKACMRLAKAAGVDSMVVHTFTLQTIGEEMKRVGINQNIKLIDFAGETCSLMMYSYMRETFPNAKIISYYGMTETEGPAATPCRAFSDEEPFAVFHEDEGFHIDLIDPETEAPLVPKPGVEGEILLTDLHGTECSFPLVRYRPGDAVRVVDTTCKEHGTWTFTVLGRTASDFMQVPGGQLRADEIERILRSMPTVITDHFEMHRYDTGTPQKPQLRVELHVQPLDQTIDLDTLAQTIAKELRVSPTRTYATGVADGLYESLVCKVLPKGPTSAKHKRMVRH